jgi:CheY-like chemotaxis protein
MRTGSSTGISKIKSQGFRVNHYANIFRYQTQVGMRKIFVVDNDVNITSELAKCLTEDGFDVTISNEGSEALQMLDAQTFNLVIADIYLAGLDNYAVLNWHTLHKPETKVIMTTGQDSRSVSHAALRMGALYCLEKPISKEYLLETVHEAMNEVGFSGTISKITLADYLQLCIYTTASKTFEVIKGAKKGIIVIQEGVISYAKHGDLTGEEAFNTILSWQMGRINEIRLPNIPEPNIFIESGFLLLEAVRIHDEKQMLSDLAIAGEAGSGSVSGGTEPVPDDKQVGEAKRTEENPYESGSKSGIGSLLEKTPGILEYCVFDERDILQDKSVELSAIMHLAPSLHLGLSDSLCELVGGKCFKYLVFSTTTGVRYLLIRMNKSQVVVGLKPGIKPGDFLNEIFSDTVIK